MIFALIPAIVAVLLAQDAQVTQDGSGWKRVYPGVLTEPPARLIKISTRGHVVLRGSQTDQITYKLTQHVRARSEREAHALFGSVVTSMALRNGVSVITLLPMTRDKVNAEWEISVPRRVAGVILDTQLGDVEAYDLESTLRIDTN